MANDAISSIRKILASMCTRAGLARKPLTIANVVRKTWKITMHFKNTIVVKASASESAALHHLALCGLHHGRILP
ncbi:hypothetical protein O9992_27325 [Vibrio lentus]|nr:hypothetical protein [Vibrio lentus]